MEQIRAYLFSVILAAFVCSLLESILKNFKAGRSVKFLCGILMTMSVLRPVPDWEGLAIQDFFASGTEQAAEAAAMGQQYAYRARADIIKLKTEAYILDKAMELGADICADVTVSESDDAAPVSVQISGQLSPYTKQQLEKILQQNLGIAKENQQWIG